MQTVTYDCPNCGAGLTFNSDTQKFDCKFCLSSFTVEQMDEIYKKKKEGEVPDPLAGEGETESGQPVVDEAPKSGGEEQDYASQMRVWSCNSCGAQILADENTAATFCPYCQNPTVIPGQVQGKFAPKQILPFRLKADAAQDALQRLCKKRPLLPGDFKKTHQIEKLTGIYTPFWLYDCAADASLQARAERVQHWSDSNYRYTKTDVYSITRGGQLQFEDLPVDGSKKMDNALMDGMEPFDFGQLKPFSMAYLSGYLAERYDEDAQQLYPRVRDRVTSTSQQLLKDTIMGYAAVQVSSANTQIKQIHADYVMLPVWMLNTRYKGETYTFAMNGQTGKMVGRLPLSKKRMLAWFAGVSTVVFGLIMLGGGLLL
ncbi:hypothetical protein H8K20_12115 [Neobittarella massiliensis]|uniref:Uncharacterized protein n=1 Tax=Neobittarella massiliensis (ex Bilen et al. 2018) TaxID=2041842 RepID=A0A8J6IQH3_9FIRM|nr:hypothetical protein [Neobittarella massiliensis]MBC3517135.1 hypothetical protein [Neobittarella massiliensis]